MEKTRLEAFSDGVFAIIITIMVLELKVPHDASWSTFLSLWSVFSSYVMSFLFVGIYWGNHHHMMHAVKRVHGGMIWANLNLLFWLSLIPFATGWMGENHFDKNTVIVYALLLLICGLSYTVLQNVIVKSYQYPEVLIQAFAKSSRKGNVSILLYSLAIAFAFVNPLLSCLLFLTVSIMWLIPERNIERALQEIRGH